MKTVSLHDLKERLTLMGCAHEENAETGGWRQSDQQLGEVWAYIEPIMGTDGYHPDDLGGGMSARKGYLKNRPAARYRVVVRSHVDLKPVVEFEWKRADGNKRLLVVEEPYLVQSKNYWCVRTVEQNES